VDSFIIGGDLNFTVERSKIWGPKAHEDNLSSFFIESFEHKGWVDVEPTKFRPTWSNNRCGEDVIAKCLYLFLIHHNIIDKMGMYRSWVGQTHASDHFPIFLEWVSLMRGWVHHSSSFILG